MKTLYKTQVVAKGGRDGHVRSEDGVLDLALSIPKALGGPGKAATNPEQLFAAGYAACFENALLHVARGQGVKLGATQVTASVGIGPREDGGFALDVALEVGVGGIELALAEELVHVAHRVCPYSHAVRGNIEVAIHVSTLA